MQTELFVGVLAAPAEPKRRATRLPIDRVVVATGLAFETWVSYPARTVNAEDGLRVEFSVPVHMDLVRLVPTDKREILCKYRVRKGFAWGGLGRAAKVKVEGDLCEGPRGGKYLHCREVTILEAHPIKGEMLSKSMMRKLEKKALNRNGAPDALQV